MEDAFRQDMVWYLMMGVCSVIGSVGALCKLKALAISRRCCRCIAGSRPSVLQLLQTALPDHEFFEEQRGIWISGPTFPWASASSDEVWMQRGGPDKWGNERQHPWTLLDFDEEFDATTLPRRRIVTPALAPWTRTPVAANGLQLDSIAANGWVDYPPGTPVAASDLVSPSIAADGWVDDGVLGSPTYQELPSGDAEEGLDNAQVWEPPLDSVWQGPIEWF